MLSDKIYLLRFTHRKDYEIEELDYSHAKDAWKAFSLFIDPECAKLYTRIEILEFSLRTHKEALLAAFEFSSPAN